MEFDDFFERYLRSRLAQKYGGLLDDYEVLVVPDVLNRWAKFRVRQCPTSLVFYVQFDTALTWMTPDFMVDHILQECVGFLELPDGTGATVFRMPAVVSGDPVESVEEPVEQLESSVGRALREALEAHLAANPGG